MSLAQRFWLVLGAVLLATVIALSVLGDRLLSGVTVPAAELVRAASGVGDPYLPEAGGAGYDLLHYDVRVNAVALGKELRGTTTVTAVARQDLDEFHLDLHLAARSVVVDGVAATFVQQESDLAITAARRQPELPAIASGAGFVVTVVYDGDPSAITLHEAPGFYRLGKEFLIAGEPEAAALWYPSNDHPRDPATMDFAITVPRGQQAICAGRLIEHGADPDVPDADRWVWRIDAPTVTYASFLAVGSYRIEQGDAGGRPFVYAVSTRLSSSRQTKALRWLRQTHGAVDKLEKYLGPYPFSGIGGFVPGMEPVWGGLETAMNPIYHPRMVDSEMVLNHELAHMWLGDTITLTEWNDLFDNESLASYADWLVTSGSSPAQNFDRYYRGWDWTPEFWTPALSDPGLKELFVRVYDRGPTAVHALRNRMGDTVFFQFLRDWAQQDAGPRSLEDFRRAADEATPEDLTGFFAEWLDQTDRPEPTRANGVLTR
ncbi:MAG: M1 family metallopeptidase [Micropruina sp.]|uniref:M1 family metallopeptidase n=1 Tax=Micropruina sp. TaxID=2737536 RepID=UPI0039E3616A